EHQKKQLKSGLETSSSTTGLEMPDRTAEFHGAVKVFRRSFPVDAVVREPADRKTPSDFLLSASNIALGFEGTSKLIERVKKLVGRKGFSNNPAAEINDVMGLFEGDIAGLQRDINLLYRYADGNSRGSPRPNSQRQKHCQHIVATLQHTAKEHTKAFRDALLQRAAVEKQQSERQQIFSHSRGVAPMAKLDYPLFGAGGGQARGSGRHSRRHGHREGRGGGTRVPSRGLDRDSEENGHHSPRQLLPPDRAASATDRQAGQGLQQGEEASGGQKPPLPLPIPSPGGEGIFGRGAGVSGGGPNLNSHESSTTAAGGGRGGVNWPQQPPKVQGVTGHIKSYGAGEGEQGGGPRPQQGVTVPFQEGAGVNGQARVGSRKAGGGGGYDAQARRAAWQVQVQEDSKNRLKESHKVQRCL
ncbi:unnamed protein product, partial [Discosporangium mesarthrocarpum]